MRRQYPAPDERRCTHRYDSGERCAQWKMKAYDTCPSHTPEIRQKMGGPTKGILNGRQNGYKSGWRQKPLKPMATLEDLLDDLLIRHTQLSLAITDEIEALPLETFARLVSLQTTNALRINRLMKSRGTEQDNGLDKLLKQALDELSEELGIKL